MNKSYRTHPRLVLLAVVTALALAGAAATVAVRAADKNDKNEKKADEVKPALTVNVTQPQRATIATAINANGNIAAWQEAIIGAEASGWRLAEVRVNVGDVVRRGQVLATFAADMPQADLAQRRAEVAEAEALLADASTNAQRARELQATGALSAQQINQYFTTERTAQARLEALRAAAKAQQLRLSQAQVLAPDNGVISARSATVGAVVGAGQELFRMIRGGRLEWRAEVATTDLAQIKPGQVARVTTAGGSTVQGKVRMVAPTVDPATRNGIVYVDLPALPAGVAGGARAGMFARGEFEIGSSSALTLPQSAVLMRDGFAWVFKVGNDNKVQQAKVNVGRRVADRIEVIDGIDPNTRVVASGGGFLADGDMVRVVTAAAPAASTATAPVPAPAGKATTPSTATAAAATAPSAVKRAP
ncbi:MAG TPA: efflux RND transporter periplasmic adaptor subunit [Rubrivivax sp.]|nr:efflux RND transporter periplasmic adaptor subunit [Rubrivivax sp.]